MAKRIEDLPIHSKIDEFWEAINAILDRPAVRKDVDLHDEISRANESIGSNMVEGFEQGTDRAFAHYLRYSKASVAEVLKRLRKAYYRRYITRDELKARLDQGDALGKMLGGFIKYLEASDFKDRGYHRAVLDREQKDAPQPPRKGATKRRST